MPLDPVAADLLAVLGELGVRLEHRLERQVGRQRRHDQLREVKGEEQRADDRTLQAVAADGGEGARDGLAELARRRCARRRARLVGRDVAEGARAGRQAGVDAQRRQEADAEDQIADRDVRGPVDLVEEVNRGQILGREVEVAGDDHRPHGHQQAGHRFGPPPLQRLVEEGADRQRDGGERLVAGLAEHDVAVAGERVAHAGEEQQVELDEGQARVGPRGPELPSPSRRMSGRASANTATALQGKSPNPSSRIRRLEGVGRRAAARDAAHQRGVFAGHDVAEAERQQHQRAATVRSAKAQKPRAPSRQVLAPNGCVGRDVGANPRLGQRAGAVVDGRGGDGNQPVPDHQRRHQRQERQDHARHARRRPATPSARPSEAEQPGRAGGGGRRAARRSGRARPSPAPARR